MQNVTSLQHAKMLKLIGLPLNMEVQSGGKFTKKNGVHWCRMMNAHDDFIRSLSRYGEAETFREWRRFKKSFNALLKECEHCDAYVGKFCNDGANVEAKVQVAILAYFLRERAVPFLSFFAEVIDRIPWRTIQLASSPPFVTFVFGSRPIALTPSIAFRTTGASSLIRNGK